MKSLLLLGLIVGAAVLFACIIVFRPDVLRPDVFNPDPNEPIAVSAGPVPTGPSFAVQVDKPRSARPLFGLLPAKIEAKLAGHGDLVFDHTSPGAVIGGVSDNRLELSADGWSLMIETTGEGTVTAETHLVFSLLLANQRRTLRCRPADPAQGHLSTAEPAAPDTRDGSFLVELAICENTETGQTIEWPPVPLTVRGSFQGLPDRRASPESGAPDQDE